jgi:deoxyadenosine/deoxycytidine kinase
LSAEVMEEQNCYKLENISDVHDVFEIYRNDPKRWSFTIQSQQQLGMLEIHRRKIDSSVKIMERSLHSGRFCYIENLKNFGYLTDTEAEILCEYYEWMVLDQEITPNLYVYLESTPTIVEKRIVARGSFEIQKNVIEYLTNLHELHEKWLHAEKVPVVKIPSIEFDDGWFSQIVSILGFGF